MYIYIYKIYIYIYIYINIYISKLWVCPISVKIEIFERLFKRCFFLLNYYLW